MTDTAIIAIAEKTVQGLSGVDPEWEFPRLVPIYNGLMHAAKANHPGDPLLNTLEPVEASTGKDGICVAEMKILFGVLQIALASLQSASANGSN